MSDFRLKVIAETQEAERKLERVQEHATKVEKPRSIKIELPNYTQLSKNFTTLSHDIENAANSVRSFYRVASKMPVGPVAEINEVASQMRAVGTAAVQSGKSAGNAGAVITNTLGLAGKTAESLVGKLTRIAFSLYAISEAAKITQAAFSGLFNETVGREIQLRETILKTQTTLASTNKVFADGREITKPYEKIVTLTSAVADRIDSIRERSIALAGVTSNEVIEVFGIVASQVGQIGGGLKEAEDLAINFAAALGTFGIPLYQARQEIGSILRGDITLDSYLAKALGITNEDIAKAKTSTEGVVGFLEERLAAAVAGQRIAAEGFAGVASNIRDLSELINQNFGRGLLDPLIDGLTKVFDFLFNIRNEMFKIAELAGSSVGTLLSIGFGRTLGASGGTRRTEYERTSVGSRGTKRAEAELKTVSTSANTVLNNIESLIKRVTTSINEALSTVYLQLATLVERASNAFGVLAKGLTALSLGILSLELEKIKALIGAIEALSPALLAATKGVSAFFSAWGEFLKLPLVQEFTQIAANMRLLEAIGIIPLIKAGLLLQVTLANWGRVTAFVVKQFNNLRAIIGLVVASLGSFVVSAGAAGTALLSAWQPANKALQSLKAELQDVIKQLSLVGAAAQQAGSKIGSLETSGKKAKGGILALIGNFIKFNLKVLAVSAVLGLLLERFSAFKEEQDRLASSRRAEEAMRRLQTTYKDVGDSADAATKRAKQFEEALVNAEYEQALQRLEDLRKKIEEIKDLTSDNELTFGTFFRRLAQLFNPANFGALFDMRRGELFADTVLRRRQEQARKAEEDKAKWAANFNKLAAERDIKIQAQNRVNLEKEIEELRRRIESDLFQQRQALAQKEVEIFRLAGEMRIKQIERANEKLIEGEEGASRAALEALNTYIATRERGELEIESAKKTLAIEVTNLEKAISDYRYDIEKKIAALRKKSAQQERDSANARQRAAGGTTTAAPGVSSGFRVGSTGTSTGPHLDIRSPTGNKQAVVNEALSIIKAWQKQNLEYIQLSNVNIDVKNMFDEAELRKALVKEQTVHARRSGGGAIDIAVPAGTLVPVPAGTPSWGGAGGWQATSLQTGNLFLHGLGTSVASPTSAAAAAAAPPPAADAAVDMPDATEAADNYAAAVRSLTSAMERYRALQEAVTNANTAEAFDRIAQSFFPRAQLEQYEDRLQEVRFTYDAIASSSAEAFNPERSAIEVTRLTALAAASRELEQVQKGIADKAKAGQLNEAERVKAIDAVNARYKQHINDLGKVAALQRSILSTEQATTLITQLRNQARNVREDIEALQLRNRLEAESVAPEFIAAEIAKLDIQRQVERTTRELNEQLEAQIELRDRLQAQIAGASDADKAKLQKDLDAARKELARLRDLLKAVPEAGTALAAAEDARARAATEPGTRIASFIGSAKRELKDLESAAIRVSQSIGDAIGNSISNGISGLIEGTTTAEQVFSDFLKNIGRILVQEATKMIATYIAIGVARQFAGLLGFGVPSPTERGAFSIGQAATLALPSFDGGGFTGAGIRSGGLDGKGGFPALLHPNEVVMPLERGNNSMQQAATAQLPFTRSTESLTPAQVMQAAGPIEIKYESTVINGVEYVTREQAERIGAQSAERGRALTLDTIFNSPKVRRKAGL